MGNTGTRSIVEDEANIRSFIKANLKNQRLSGALCGNLVSGMMMYASHHPISSFWILVCRTGWFELDSEKVWESDTVPIIVKLPPVPTSG